MTAIDEVLIDLSSYMNRSRGLLTQRLRLRQKWRHVRTCGFLRECPLPFVAHQYLEQGIRNAKLDDIR